MKPEEEFFLASLNQGRVSTDPATEKPRSMFSREDLQSPGRSWALWASGRTSGMRPLTSAMHRDADRSFEMTGEMQEAKKFEERMLWASKHKLPDFRPSWDKGKRTAKWGDQGWKTPDTTWSEEDYEAFFIRGGTPEQLVNDYPRIKGTGEKDIFASKADYADMVGKKFNLIMKKYDYKVGWNPGEVPLNPGSTFTYMPQYQQRRFSRPIRR